MRHSSKQLDELAEQIIDQPDSFSVPEIMDVLDGLEDNYFTDELHDVLIEEAEIRGEELPDDFSFSYETIL